MFNLAYVALVFSVILTSVKGSPVSPPGDLIEVASQNGFDTFLELLTAANLKHRLEGEDKFIIFAPTNQAFEEIGKTELSRLKSDPDSLERILLSHISQQEKQPDGVFDGVILKTLTPGQELKISFSANGTFVNGKEFNENGIEAKNGILYPTNKVLLYSPVNNDNHNRVMEESSGGSESLIRVLMNNGCMTLAALMSKANLFELETSGTYTIFAPKDEAFASLSSDEFLFMKSNDILLKNLIKSHITEGEFLSYTLEDGLIIESLSSGYSLKFLVEDNGSITVNNVPIIVKDLKAFNGVVYVISNILISSSKSLRSENPRAVLISKEDSITNVEHVVGSFVEVTGLTINDDSKSNASFYVAINENTVLNPSSIDDTSERIVAVNSSAPETSENGDGHNITPTENDAENTVNTLEANKAESEQKDETKNKGDSSVHSDSVDKMNFVNPTEPLKNEEQPSNSTSEAKTKITEENVTEGNLDNENEINTNSEGNSGTECSTTKLYGKSNLNEEATTNNQNEDSATTAAVAGAEFSFPNESSANEEAEIKITSSIITITKE